MYAPAGSAAEHQKTDSRYKPNCSEGAQGILVLLSVGEGCLDEVRGQDHGVDEIEEG